MRLPPRRDIHDLTGPRIPRCRLWFGVPRFQHTESTHFDSAPFDQLFTHRRENTIYHFHGGEFRDSGGLGDLLGQFAFRYGVQSKLPSTEVNPG